MNLQKQESQPKRCIRCGEIKPLKDFNKDKNSNDGFSRYCRLCVSSMYSKHSVVDDLEGEIWKDIAGFGGSYKISNMGRVKHVRSYFCETLRVPYVTHSGYLRVLLSWENKRKWVSIHREVAKAFIPNPNNWDSVNHKDFDKKNNKQENLEWLSIGDNIIHAKNSGKNNRKPVIQYDMVGNIIREWDSAWKVEKEIGYFSSLISRCCRNKSKSYKGFKWRFKYE